VQARHNQVHETLEGRTGIAQPEWHCPETVHTPRADESCLVGVRRGHSDLMVRRAQVDGGEPRRAWHHLANMIEPSIFAGTE